MVFIREIPTDIGRRGCVSVGGVVAFGATIDRSKIGR